jgi:hypothetical protein
LANLLGYGLGVTGVKRSKADPASDTAVEMAARSANVSYGDSLPPETLRHALLTGAIPPNYIPQLRALLDEAPLNVLSAVVAQLESENGAARKATWQKMRQLAAAVACTRGIWS